MREAELLDELANFQELKNPNWDLETRKEMCAEAVAYGKLTPEVARLAFGEQVFTQAMPLVVEVLKKIGTEKINTEGVPARPEFSTRTTHGLADRIRSILLRVLDASPRAQRYILPCLLAGAIVGGLLLVRAPVIRTADNLLHGRGLYSGTVPDATVLTIIEPTTDIASNPSSEKESELRAKISEQISDIVRKLGRVRPDAPSTDDEQRAVREVLQSSEEVNESLQKLERKIRELSQTLKVDAPIQISHEGLNLKLAKAVPL